MDILLTSENFIKSQFNISDNLDNKFILSAIRETQDIEFQSLVGTKMLNKLQNLVSGGTISDSENEIYKTLLDKAQYFIAYHTIAKCCLTSSSKLSNTGVFSTNDENVQAFPLSDVYSIMNQYIHKADHYGYLLQLWMIDNHASLPELTKNKIEEINSNLYSSASGGLWLGGSRGRGMHNIRRRHIGYDLK